MKPNRTFYTLAKQLRWGNWQMPRAYERRLQMTEAIVNKIINGIITDVVASARSKLAAPQVSLSAPQWEYLVNGTQFQQGISSLLSGQQTGVDILTPTGWNSLERAVRELLRNHFEMELRRVGSQVFASTIDIGALVKDAIEEIHERVQEVREQQQANKLQEWLDWLTTQLATVAGKLSPTTAAVVARHLLLNFPPLYKLSPKAQKWFNDLVRIKEESFIGSAIDALETNARSDVNAAIEDLVQRFKKVWQAAVAKYQQQAGSPQSQVTPQQIEIELLAELQKEYQNWVNQVIPVLEKNISNRALHVMNVSEGDVVEVVKQLVNIYKQAVTSRVPEAALEDALGQVLESGGRTTTTPSSSAVDANIVVNSFLDSLEKLTRALQRRNRNDLVDAVSDVKQTVSPNSPFVTGLSNFPQVANQISPWLYTIRHTPVDVDNDTSIKAFLNLLVNVLNILSAGGLQLNPTTAGRLNRVINDIRSHLQPTGGAPTVYKSIKWRVENPWQQLARVKWGGQKAPKEITKLMLWLPQLSEKERAFIMPYLYRYWLAIDKEEKKERLEELKRAARKLGITL